MPTHQHALASLASAFWCVVNVDNRCFSPTSKTFTGFWPLTNPLTQTADRPLTVFALVDFWGKISRSATYMHIPRPWTWRQPPARLLLHDTSQATGTRRTWRFSREQGATRTCSLTARAPSPAVHQFNPPSVLSPAKPMISRHCPKSPTPRLAPRQSLALQASSVPCGNRQP